MSLNAAQNSKALDLHDIRVIEAQIIRVDLDRQLVLICQSSFAAPMSVLIPWFTVSFSMCTVLL